MYIITPRQWDLIEPTCKHIEPGGKLFFLEHDDATGNVTPVEVVLSDNPPAIEPPAHYADVWPSDPRD